MAEPMTSFKKKKSPGMTFPERCLLAEGACIPLGAKAGKLAKNGLTSGILIKLRVTGAVEKVEGYRKEDKRTSNNIVQEETFRRRVPEKGASVVGVGRGRKKAGYDDQHQHMLGSTGIHLQGKRKPQGLAGRIQRVFHRNARVETA